MPLTLGLALGGVIVASLAHLSISRHAPIVPPGWAYLWSAWEVGVPSLLAGAWVWPAHAGSLHGIAAAFALVVGAASVLVAWQASTSLPEHMAEASVGRAVVRSHRWTTDLVSLERATRRGLIRPPPPPEA